MTPDQLKDTLRMAKLCAKRILSLLEQERQALAGRDSVVIEQLVTAKLQAFERWEQLESQRRGLLQKSGLANDNRGMEQFLARADHSGELNRAWRELQDLTARCRQENQLNGNIIDIHRRQASEALAILSGQLGRLTGYAASGNAQRSSENRLLGEA